ncbi:MAG: class C beta-lactamase-related serine hydrolase [Bacteroidetes bacterium]|nr:MAG: class C beta-lactamase-related serine hydrolase [Bacteroidota bacterium]
MLNNAIFFVLMLGTSLLLKGQIPNNDLKAYQTARQGIVLLGNESGLLPLQGLDTLRPLLVSAGLGTDNVLYQTLNAYQPTAYMELEAGEEAEIVWPVGHWTADPNVVIFAVNTESPALQQIDWATVLMSEGVSSINCFFGRGAFLAYLPASPNQIFSESTSPWAQSLVAQALFGAIKLDQRLAESISEVYPEGSGITLNPIGRLAFAPPSALEMNTELLLDSIRSIVEEGRLYGAYPGAQVLVAKSGTIVYHETFGYHSDQILTPVRKTDLYDLASVTKVSSALAALMRWYGKEEFELDAPLSQYYPAATGSNKADLTFRDMLAHQAGLRPWIPYWQNTLRGNGRYPWSRRYDPARTNDYRFRWRTFRRDSSGRFPIYVADDLWLHRRYPKPIVKAILKSPLEEKVQYRYSGLLFYLLPQIVAQQSGQDYETYLKETFYRPLGAHTITYNPLRYFARSRIIPTERDSFFRMTDLHGYVHDEGAAMMGGVSANAGLFANAYDLAKLWQMYLNGGTYAGQSYIDSTAVAEFTRCQFCDTGNRRGLGFDKPLIEYDPATSSVAAAASPASFGHSGYTGTFVWADPETELLYLFLSNRVYPTRANRVIYTRNIRPRIHAAIYKALGEE